MNAVSLRAAWALLVLAVLLAFPQPSKSDDVTVTPAPAGNATAVTAKILRFGVYRTKAKGESQTEPNSGTGKMTLAGKAELINPTDEIHGETGVEFGVEFTVDAPGEETVPVTIRMRHPSITNPVTGESSERTQWPLSPKPGEPAYTGWEFTYDWEIQPGSWTLQILHGPDILTEKAFTVTRSLKRSKDSKNLVVMLGSPKPEPTPAPAAKTREKAPAPSAVPQASPAPKATPDSPNASAIPVAVVQIGTFRDRASAEAIVELLQKKKFSPSILVIDSSTGEKFHTLVLGPFTDLRAAEKAAAKYRSQIQKAARINSMDRREFDRLKMP